MKKLDNIKEMLELDYEAPVLEELQIQAGVMAGGSAKPFEDEDETKTVDDGDGSLVE